MDRKMKRNRSGVMGSERLKYLNIICPFFVKWTTTSVTCEGINPGSRCTSQTFPNWQELDRFVRHNCCIHNPECEIYRLLLKKYEKT